MVWRNHIHRCRPRTGSCRHGVASVVSQINQSGRGRAELCTQLEAREVRIWVSGNDCHITDETPGIRIHRHVKLAIFDVDCQVGDGVKRLRAVAVDRDAELGEGETRCRKGQRRLADNLLNALPRVPRRLVLSGAYYRTHRLLQSQNNRLRRPHRAAIGRFATQNCRDHRLYGDIGVVDTLDSS